MKKFVKILSIFAFALLCLALPLTITGCGETEDVELGELNCDLTFSVKNVNEHGGDVTLKDGESPFGELYSGNKKLSVDDVVKVWEGSHVYVSTEKKNGLTTYILKIGNKSTYKTIKAIPRDGTNEFSYTYALKDVDYGGVTAIKESTDVKISFKREPKTYKIIFDANGKTINETLPTNVTWTVGKSLVDGGFDDSKPLVTAAGFKLNTTIVQSTGKVDNTGFSITPTSVSKSNVGANGALAESWALADKFTNANSQVNIQAGTIKLFALWVEQTYTVNICKNVLTWKNQSTTIHTQVPETWQDESSAFQNSGVKVALYLNNEVVYNWDDEQHIETTATSIKFKQIEFFDEQGITLHYHIYASKSLTEIDTLVDTGREVNVYWNNGSFAANKEYIAYQDVTLEKDENTESVTGAGTYLMGTQATVTATSNTGASFVKWTKYVVPEEGDPEYVDASEELSYTFEVNVPIKLKANCA